MATIVTYNAARTLEIEENTTVDGSVNGVRDLILERRNGTTFNAGSVDAPVGDQGPERPQSAGQISLFAGSVAPQGWAFCDGAAVSRALLPDLFNVIGTKYGVGDGVYTFNLPDLKGRVPVGLDAAQTEFDVLGEKGGSKTHALTESELPAHTHTVLGYSSKDDENFTGNVGRMNASDALVNSYDKPTLPTGGAGTPEHNNLQPYATTNYIISLGTAAPQGGGVAALRYFKQTGRGTTAQRDARFTIPANHDARVALANQRPIWYNTDLGWEESYYMPSGSSGLTVTGLISGATYGWYPTGEGPYITLDATEAYLMFLNTTIGGFGNPRRKGGDAWFTTSLAADNGNLIEVKQHGRYDIRAWTKIFEGTGAPDLVLQVTSDGSAMVNGVSGGAFTKHVTYHTRVHQELLDIYVIPGRKIAWRLQAGTMSGSSMTLHVSELGFNRGQITIRYVGPPLVTD